MHKMFIPQRHSVSEYLPSSSETLLVDVLWQVTTLGYFSVSGSIHGSLEDQICAAQAIRELQLPQHNRMTQHGSIV